MRGRAQLGTRKRSALSRNALIYGVETHAEWNTDGINCHTIPTLGRGARECLRQTKGGASRDVLHSFARAKAPARAALEQNRRPKLLLARELDRNAKQQLAIIFFHLPQQAADAIDEGSPLPGEPPFLGR